MATRNADVLLLGCGNVGKSHILRYLRKITYGNDNNNILEVDEKEWNRLTDMSSKDGKLQDLKTIGDIQCRNAADELENAKKGESERSNILKSFLNNIQDKILTAVETHTGEMRDVDAHAKCDTNIVVDNSEYDKYNKVSDINLDKNNVYEGFSSLKEGNTSMGNYKIRELTEKIFSDPNFGKHIFGSSNQKISYKTPEEAKIHKQLDMMSEDSQLEITSLKYQLGLFGVASISTILVTMFLIKKYKQN